MRGIFTLIFFVTVTGGAFAQTETQPGNVKTDSLQDASALTAQTVPAAADTLRREDFKKNIIKTNLSSLVLFNSYNLSYERSLTRKITFVAGYSFMPQENLASIYLVEKLYSSVETAAESFVGEDVDVTRYLDLATVGNKSATGEVRFYTGQHPGARGFYLSLYGRYMNMGAAYPHDYETNGKTYRLPFDGTLKGFGGGVMIGSQWLIAKRVTLDWYILGAHFGKLKVDMPAVANLSTMTEAERLGLEADIESVNEESGGKVDVDATVTDKGVSLKGNGPYRGIRSMGFSLGVAF